MYYLIYKITNNLNGKIYIGQHQTDNLDDGYMGSGQNIKRAINKYGLENFTKEILYYCTDWDTMNSMEEVVVNQDFVDREDTYNLRLGGSRGAFSEESLSKMSESHKGHIIPEVTREKLSDSTKRMWQNSEVREKIIKSNTGKKRTDLTKQRISNALTGKHLSEESKKKISESKKGVQAWNKGKPLSEEHRRRLSESHKGQRRPHSEETKRKISEARKRHLMNQANNGLQ